MFFFFRYSDQVSIGDEVLVKENNQVIPGEVINVVTLTLQGDCISILCNYVGSLFCCLTISQLFKFIEKAWVVMNLDEII